MQREISCLGCLVSFSGEDWMRGDIIIELVSPLHLMNTPQSPHSPHRSQMADSIFSPPFYRPDAF